MIVTHSCGVSWQQIGDRTSHCPDCHRTFSSLEGFDAHQRMVSGRSVCRDPATLLAKVDGEARFRTFIDLAGATVWRSTREIPPGTFDRHAPNQSSVPPDQAREAAPGTEVPLAGI